MEVEVLLRGNERKEKYEIMDDKKQEEISFNNLSEIVSDEEQLRIIDEAEMVEEKVWITVIRVTMMALLSVIRLMMINKIFTIMEEGCYVVRGKTLNIDRYLILEMLLGLIMGVVKYNLKGELAITTIKMIFSLGGVRIIRRDEIIGYLNEWVESLETVTDRNETISKKMAEMMLGDNRLIPIKNMNLSNWITGNSYEYNQGKLLIKMAKGPDRESKLLKVIWGITLSIWSYIKRWNTNYLII